MACRLKTNWDCDTCAGLLHYLQSKCPLADMPNKMYMPYKSWNKIHLYKNHLQKSKYHKTKSIQCMIFQSKDFWKNLGIGLCWLILFFNVKQEVSQFVLYE